MPARPAAAELPSLYDKGGAKLPPPPGCAPNQIIRPPKNQAAASPRPPATPCRVTATAGARQRRAVRWPIFDGDLLRGNRSQIKKSTFSDGMVVHNTFEIGSFAGQHEVYRTDPILCPSGARAHGPAGARLRLRWLLWLLVRPRLPISSWACTSATGRYTSVCAYGTCTRRAFRAEKQTSSVQRR